MGVGFPLRGNHAAWHDAEMDIDAMEADPRAAVMVRDQIAARGVTDTRVLRAMERLPRTVFVPQAQWQNAYDDRPLPIGDGQTISQPYMVAHMTELLHLRPDARVLEIGTGSGYQTALLAALASQVVSIERFPDLARQARVRLQRLGFENIEIHAADGTLGWPSRAPYDAILVTAGAPEVPEALVKQLADGGTLVCPAGARDLQDLIVVRREGNTVHRHAASRCVFVPLIGAEGWPEAK